jgi:large subunit ribosomal protein L29
MKTSELRAKSKEELNELVLSLKKERFNLRFQEATGALESKLRFREVKKTIARAKTILNEQPGSVAPKAEKAPKAAKAPAKKKTAKAKKEE